MPAAAPARPHGRRGRCRSARGSPRRAGSSGACPCRPGRAGAPAHSGARPFLAAAGPRSAPGCTRGAAGRSTAARSGARPSTPASETKCPATVLSRKRTIGVGPGRPMSAELARERRRRGPIRLGRRRPGRRTTPPAPSARRRGPAPRPARRSDPARSSCRRARRPGLPSRLRSRLLREGRPRNAADPAPREADDVEAALARLRAVAMPGVVGQRLRPCRERRGPVSRPPPRRSTRRSARTTAGR